MGNDWWLIVGFDPQTLTAITHDDHFYGPTYGEAEGLLVGRVLLRHHKSHVNLGGIAGFCLEPALNSGDSELRREY